MPARSAPTARQQRLGAELRKLRERAGLSAADAGRALGVDGSRISNIEVGRFGVSPDRVRAFAHAYKCSDSLLVEALADMAETRKGGWWSEYQETLPSWFLDIAELEHYATAIWTAQVSHLPGLLQTVDYARWTFRQNIPAPSPPQIEYLTSLRIKRQVVLYRDDPVPYTAVIHEAALRMQFGGVSVMCEQLQHIMDMSERGNVTVLVIPFSAGAFPGAGQTVLLAGGAVPQLDTVQLDSEHGSDFLCADAQLENYRTFMRRFQDMALSVADSREMIRLIINEL
ncbi:helix-turn-helix domain-containing protein [Streptomyces oceani]|uniref:HTH cro/C1-type domain-containing protein n=1 Tax=Streptomyces oceani TaxID=1075402 RepID=A0A1E7KLK9_9ACTN|nr:helix-turn-helix transcriptional regulator [Streptomyces oceani]OEV04780.1 hypothetical protein AN216_05775 [Streptomyces oceani]